MPLSVEMPAPVNTIFLPPYQRCYSSQIDWTWDTFDLSAYSGPVLLRFRFASNEQYGFTGWYIDDISITTEQATGEEDIPSAPAVNALRSVYPNPFNPSTTIVYEVSRRSPVQLKIYDVSGRAVRTLVSDSFDPGVKKAVWDGRDDRGNTVSSGVYFCRLKIGIYTATARLVLLR